MTFVQLAARRPSALAGEMELAGREMVRDLRALFWWAWFLALVLWDGARARGLRWDGPSRRHRGEHREIDDRAPLLLIVLGLLALGWGGWSFGYMLVVFA